MSEGKSKEEAESDLIVHRSKILSTIWTVLALLLLLMKRSEVGGMKPADWGDFVAGFTAPLAFGWLVVAVFIQRNELRAQIKELSASRKALEAQIEEQKLTAKALQLQHEIMKQEWDESKISISYKNKIDQICNNIYEYFSDKNVFYISSMDVIHQEYGPTENIVYMHDYFKIKTTSDVIQFLRGAREHALQVNNFLRDEEDRLRYHDKEKKSLYVIMNTVMFYRTLLNFCQDSSLQSIKIHIEKLIEIQDSIMERLRELNDDSRLVDYPYG